jgi:hypothetical protein
VLIYSGISKIKSAENRTLYFYRRSSALAVGNCSVGGRTPISALNVLTDFIFAQPKYEKKRAP